MHSLLRASLLATLTCLCWQSVIACNEAICASIVSKCMLTQSCKCDDFKLNKTCSRDCYHCLDYLYQDCCSCVEMCPRVNATDSSLASKSHVEDLPEPQPDLFNVLTEEKDHLLRWMSYTLPAKLVLLSAVTREPHGADAKRPTGSTVTDGIDREEDLAVNCTVAYMSQCMSWNKCKSSCTSMGANSYRWFHDGCCECIGLYCVNYGINESKCLQCPLTTDIDVEMSIDEPHARADEKTSDYDFEESGVNREDDSDPNGAHDNGLTASEKVIDDKFDKQVHNKKPSEDELAAKKASI